MDKSSVIAIVAVVTVVALTLAACFYLLHLKDKASATSDDEANN